MLRGHRDYQEVLVVHRPNYDDWSLPKGKMSADEYLAVTAVREVAEETGYPIRLLRQLTMARYQVNSHPKLVQWWLAEAVGEPAAEHDDETDAVEWWPVAKAIRELSYPDDVSVLTEALRVPTTDPLLIVRHAKAMNRKQWQGRDADRRLTERGRRQAKALAGLLAAFGVGQLASSSSTRCMKTLAPYAQQASLEVRAITALSEESAAANPDGVTKAMAKLRAVAQASERPLAICGHRPVLPAMFDFLGVAPNHVLRPAELALVYPADATRRSQITYIAPKL